MKTMIDQTHLRLLLANRIPEVSKEFIALPVEASVYTILHKMCEVTFVLAHQNKFNGVKRCLHVAEELLLEGDKKVSTAVYTIYIYRLGILLDQRDARAEVIRYRLPRALRTEYQRQLSSSLP